MADIVTVAASIRPLHGAIVRRFTASAAITVGQVVYVHTDGTVKPADADAEASSQARGIVVGVGVTGSTTAASGDAVDVVTHGPVELGVASNTEGAVVYVSTTAGAMDQTAPATAGDYPFVVGWMESDTKLYVQPQVIPPTVVPA